MLGRYWLPVVAVVGLALGAQANAQGAGNNSGNDRGAQKGRSQPKVDTQPPLPVAAQYDLHRLTRAVEALSQQQPSYTEERRAERNVKAQEDTATWALVMIFVGILEATITAYGVYLVWQTLKASWAAAGEAKRAADAAERAILETRRIGEAQVRAYLTIKEAFLYFTGPEGLPIIEISVANSGQSPALGFAWIPQIIYLQETVEAIGSSVEDGWEENDGVDIGSGTEWKAPLFILSDFVLEREISRHGPVPKNVAIALFIHFSWTDVFGQTFKDSTNFMGMAEVGDGEENRRNIHPANTSPWHCRLQPVAKVKVRDEDVEPSEQEHERS